MRAGLVFGLLLLALALACVGPAYDRYCASKRTCGETGGSGEVDSGSGGGSGGGVGGGVGGGSGGGGPDAGCDWAPGAATTASAPPFALEIAAGDLDADGDTDLMLCRVNASPAVDELTFVPGTGGGEFGAPVAVVTGDQCLSVTAGRVLGGTSDYALGIFGSGQTIRVLNATTQVDSLFFSNARRVGFGDLNGDGATEIAIASGSGGNNDVSVYDPSLTTELASFPVAGVVNDVAIITGAWAVMTEAAAHTVTLHVPPDAGQAQTRLQLPLGAARRLAAGDFDGDGTVDVAAAYGQAPSWILHLADGGFVSGGGSTAPLTAADVVAADVNRDGRSDLLVLGAGGAQFALGRGTEAGPMSFQVIDAGAPGGAFMVVGDWNRDGVTDVLTYAPDVGGNMGAAHIRFGVCRF